MPTIPEMDEFVNWDVAGPAAGGAAIDFSFQADSFDPNHDIDLVLANVDGDDFSFWALEHYEASNPVVAGPGLGEPEPLSEPLSPSAPQGFEGPRTYAEVPCLHCQKGRFSCKTINEGKFRGYCTSCVALRCECSFGLASGGPAPSATFPSNPWPTLGDHPGAILQEDISPELLRITSAPDVTASASTAGAEDAGSKDAAPKVGARFSREALKVLKNWLSTHTRHPYPTEEEREMLQKQTGLNKTQITNWLANARRRNKIVAPRSTSPGVRSFSNPIDISQRRGTPAPLEAMNPLERWKHSPPEHEPASVTDIARAITSSTAAVSSGVNSPYSGNWTDDGSGRSLCAVSTGSSANTSHSSSAFSHGSRGSLTSLGSFNRGRRRRRRRAVPKPSEGGPPLAAPLKTFQCTFCTETFKTKHDWQRHEKSLHLSLERWVCAPAGPRALNPENGRVCCVFCGAADPDDAHIDGHEHAACQERSPGERTFYRKDHLRQHLKLVHAVKFNSWPMEAWRVATPEIRSRCGFCSIVMDTWTIRVDHLAEHFKAGSTMAEWKGDWGFESPVLDMVENSIPPYLIHHERNSPQPYRATEGPTASPRNCYELLKAELAYCIASSRGKGTGTPTDDQLQVEACRVIFGAEVFSKQKPSAACSWLRDLIVSSEPLSRQAQLQLGPMDRQEREWMSHLEIVGKDGIFEDEPMEKQLHEFVEARSALGLTALDGELQAEAAAILGRVEEASGTPSDEFSQFLRRLVRRSTTWLAGFRQRAQLPRSDEIVDENVRPTNPAQIDMTIHNEKRLEAELAHYVGLEESGGVSPGDADLQRQARMIIYGVDDGWNQTVADSAVWLDAFKQRHMMFPNTGSPAGVLPLAPEPAMQTCPSGAGAGTGEWASDLRAAPRPGQFYLNDANCYRRLGRELSRYVASTMSPKNPNCHVPTDEELQYQARWILYDSDDAWNQTAADNAEWLRRFKKDAGILTDPSVPGLPANESADLARGGSGMVPPFALPNPTLLASICPPTNTTATAAAQGTSAPHFVRLQSLAEAQLNPPATVFCSRALEKGLVDFVAGQTAPLGLGPFPSDEALRARAREVVGVPHTPADDAWLLGRFKAMVRERLGLAEQQQDASSSASAQLTPASTDLLSMPLDMDMGLLDSQFTDIFGEMEFDLGDLPDLAGS